MDDLGRQFKDFYEKVKRDIEPLPILVAQESVNFFQDSFNRQAWVGNTTEPWKPRKDPKTAGRAILVKRGRLKRSIRRFKADWTSILVGTDVEYAAVHNNGFRGTQSVRSYHRIASRKVATRYLKNGKASKSSMKKIRGQGHEVGAFVRKINIPRRQFIGESPYLIRNIERLILRRLNNL